MLAKINRGFARRFIQPLFTLVTALVVATTGITGVEPIHAAVAPGQVGSGFAVTAADLAYILQQIKIAEQHVANTTAATGLCGALLGTGPNQLPTTLVSLGLRTVDGSCNNLQTGQEHHGAADQPFPRLSDPDFARIGDTPADLYSATAANSVVNDSQPRIISNLIVDQTSTNPVAVEVALNPARTQGNAGVSVCDANGQPTGCVPPHETLSIPNVTTDVGLSPPFNSLFTIFGQFFDHGLDKITNGGNGVVMIPLKPDDPLVAGPDHIFQDRTGVAPGCSAAQPPTCDDIPPGQRFMVVTRGHIVTGPDGKRSAPNTDSPFVDQSQTYTSHPSHQVFVREYVIDANNRPQATGKFLSEADGGMATWATVKAAVAARLGLRLVDVDVTNIPMLAADLYGNFIPGPNGLPQYVLNDGTFVEGNLANPVPAPATVRRIDTAFLNDISHAASPGNIGQPKTPDANTIAGKSLDPVAAGEYDNELLDQHYICGDGRCNENIALTAVHQIFHLEHDRLADEYIATTLPANSSLLADYQATNCPIGCATNNPALPKTFTFGQRIFQAARFVTEMQYQHLVFEEFARKVQPAINPFQPFAFNQTDINPAISAEFAHTVYRFGHSMLTDVIPRINTDGVKTDRGTTAHFDISLFDGFLNPAAFKASGNTSAGSTANIIMGLSDQIGQEIDEFVGEAVRNKLLGLPQDLPAINMARGRSEGIPSLNNFRRQVFAKTNDGQLTPYINWVDFGANLKHPLSLVNFVAAYGKHPTILNAQTLEGKRAAAKLIVNPDILAGEVPPTDAEDFMFASGSWATASTGLDDVDFWVGGLAEQTNLFGGLLGPSFNYVFEKQLTDLQNGDRFYYLARTPGMNLRTQLEGNSFAELVMRNTPAHTLKADPFATADCKFEIGRLTFPATLANPDGIANSGDENTLFGAGTINNDPLSECDENRLLLRQSDGSIRYRTSNGIDPPGINGQGVYNGRSSTDPTQAGDIIWGGVDNDTFWGGTGNDRLEGLGGDDVILGGVGNDIITDSSGFDVLKGGPGNDAIDGGPNDDIIMAGEGKDFTNGGANINETFAGPGDDFAIAGQGEDTIFGDSGDDWEEGGDQPDLLIGDSSSLFFDDHNLPGHDILIGQGGDDDYDMEGGDDIGVDGPGVEKIAGASGYDWEISVGNPQPMFGDLSLSLLGVPLPVNAVRDRYNEVEALSGWKFDDTLKGDSVIPSQVNGGGFIGCDALDAAGVARISGLNQLVTPAMLTVPSGPIIQAAVTNYCLLTGNVWGEGNILLGGAGSDNLEGRGADDILDGDRYLNVRLSVRAGVDASGLATGAEIASTDLMISAATSGSFYSGAPATTTLQAAVFAGKVNPGQIVAVREILTPAPLDPVDCPAANTTPATPPKNCDQALFSGARTEYTITTNANGSITVAHTNPAVAGVNDGIDTLWNIEQILFCDVPDPNVKGACTTRAAPIFTGAAVSVSPLTLTFAGQNAGTPASAAQTVTVTNAGLQPVSLTAIAVNSTDSSFVRPVATAGGTCATSSSLSAGGSCTINIQFAPSAAAVAGAKSGSLAITHSASSVPVNVTLTGTVTAPNASVSPTTLTFAAQNVGTTSGTQTVTLSNTGNGALSISSIAVSANFNRATGTTGDNCPTAFPGTLAAGASCGINVRFAPAAAATPGTLTGNLTVTDNAGTQTVPLTGTAVRPVASLAPTSLAFGVQGAGGSTAAQTVTLSNSGTGTLTVTNLVVGAGFARTGGTCAATFPINLAAAQNCTITLAFRPAVTVAAPGGAVTGSLAVASNSGGVPGGAPVTAALSGTVIAVPTVVADNFNRASASTLGTSWLQPIVSSAAVLRVINNIQATASGSSGSGYWNTPVGGATQAAGFTFASTTANNSALYLKATGTLSTGLTGQLTSAIRVLYNAGTVTVATSTDSGVTFAVPTGGTVSTAGNLVSGNKLLAAVDSTGKVWVWKMVGTTTTLLTSTGVALPNVAAWTTGTGRSGILLPNAGVIDDFVRY